MGPYHQIGHHSWNLVNTPECAGYGGAILSPVNYKLEDMIDQVSEIDSSTFETIFDPQLYFPQSDRGMLPEWSYYPSDVDTADTQNPVWWHGIIEDLASTVTTIGADAVCAPAIQPRSYPDAYYTAMLDLADNLAQETEAEVLPTIIVRMADLASTSRHQEIASVITGYPFTRVYLLFNTDVEPRREIREADDLLGAMSLISALESANVRVTVGYTCSDMILWRAAGASCCATGKFFNLRRFTESRFAPPAQGGGQIDYWFEEALLAFIRQADIARIGSAGIKSAASVQNPASTPIRKKIQQGKAWRAESWRHYMWWFANAHARTGGGKAVAEAMLKFAQANWAKLDAANIHLDEIANDGRWIAPWRSALSRLP